MAEDFEIDGGLPEDDENRTFVIAAAGLGGLIVLSLVCLGVYALVLRPQQEEAALQRPTDIVLTNTAVALGLTQTSEAADFTPLPTEAPPTFTATPTASDVPTQVVVLPTDTSTPFTTLSTVEPLTATAAAQLTATALAIAGGAASPTPTALPVAGFADDVGLPGLAGLAGLFLIAIFLSRRLRSGPSTAG